MAVVQGYIFGLLNGVNFQINKDDRNPSVYKSKAFFS